MREEMGNQNTSGIVDEKGTNESAEKAEEVSSGHDLKEDKAVLTQEHETEDSQHKTDRSDSHDVGADLSPPVGRLENGEQEEANGYVNEDCEPQTSATPEISSNSVEMEESNLEGGKSMLVDQVHDGLPCSLEEEVQRNDSTLEPKSALTIENLDSLLHESINIASEQQEDQMMLVEETAKTLGSVNACLIEMESSTDDTQVEENLGVDAVLNIDDNNAEKNENDLVVCDMDLAKGALSETCTCKDELAIVIPADDTVNDQKTRLLDLCAARNECGADVEEKLMVNELGNGDNTSPVDETQPPGQEINQPLSCSSAQPGMIESDIKRNRDENAVETGSLSESAEEETDQFGFSDSLKMVPSEEPEDTNEEVNDIGLVQTEALISTAANQEDDKSADESALIPPTPSAEQHSNSRPPISEHQETTESNGVESNPMIQVVLRKSPSFDFGLPFDTRSEESDQTPLLYQDRTAKRSFSNGSALSLRLKNTSVQTTEFLGKSLQYEEAVEEKTITMERSHSESSRTHPLNLPNKSAKADTVIKAKQENSAADENSLNPSASNEDRAIVSPKENGKRKPRPSLFTTCICCTAAIS